MSKVDIKVKGWVHSDNPLLAYFDKFGSWIQAHYKVEMNHNWVIGVDSRLKDKVEWWEGRKEKEKVKG